MDKINILLVDDHTVLRQGTRQLLEQEPDFKVVGEAGDGEEALQLAIKLHPDVIIMDVAMPRLNGIEAAKQIKQVLPSAAILVLTGYDYDEYIMSLLEAGAAGYLLKSVSGDDLIEAVRLVHSGEPVLHPVVVRKMMAHFQAVKKPTERQPWEELSGREMEVLKLAAKGMSNKDISQALFISDRTVQAHLRTIFKKLTVGSRWEAVAYGLRHDWFILKDLP